MKSINMGSLDDFRRSKNHLTFKEAQINQANKNGEKNTIKTIHAFLKLNIQKINIALLQILRLAPFLYLNTLKK